MVSDQQRSMAFARRLHGRMSTEVVPFRWGSAFLDEEFRLRYGSNFLWVDGSPRISAEELAAEADRILGGAGFEHRVVLVDPPQLVDRLRAGFAELGWSCSTYVLMVLRHDPPVDDTLPEAYAADHARALPLLEHHIRLAPWSRNEATVRTLADYPGKLEQTIGARFFLADADGVPAASCELYLDGEEAQVESVQTLPTYRRRRLGAAVVVAAIRAARNAGATWIHLYAEENDWPVEWYERLGFERAGSFGEFARYPDH